MTHDDRTSRPALSGGARAAQGPAARDGRPGRGPRAARRARPGRPRPRRSSRRVLVERRRHQPAAHRDRRPLLQAAGAAPADGGRPARDRLGGQDQHRPRARRRPGRQHRRGRRAAICSTRRSRSSSTSRAWPSSRRTCCATRSTPSSAATSALAQHVLDRDDELDALKTLVFRELLTHMLRDPATIEPSLDLILISRHLERIGDHATNVAEDVIFMVSAKDVRHHQDTRASRPRSGSGVGRRSLRRTAELGRLEPGLSRMSDARRRCARIAASGPSSPRGGRSAASAARWPTWAAGCRATTGFPARPAGSDRPTTRRRRPDDAGRLSRDRND